MHKLCTHKAHAAMHALFLLLMTTTPSALGAAPTISLPNPLILESAGSITYDFNDGVTQPPGAYGAGTCYWYMELGYIRSCTISDNQVSNYAFYTTAHWMSFDFSVESEGADALRIYVDGGVFNTVHGADNTGQIPIGTGEDKQIVFEYYKDGSVSIAPDRAKIDNLVLGIADIKYTSPGATDADGDPLTIVATEFNVPGGTFSQVGSTFEISVATSNLVPCDSGEYPFSLLLTAGETTVIEQTIQLVLIDSDSFPKFP